MTEQTTEAKALPEKWRKARNIQEGYELRFTAPDGSHVWLPVKSALHITSPLKISTFTLDVSGQDGWDDGDRVTVRPDTDVMSRRLAVTQ